MYLADSFDLPNCILKIIKTWPFNFSSSYHKTCIHNQLHHIHVNMNYWCL